MLKFLLIDTMCGVAGFIDYNHIGDVNIVQKMADSLTHRGPNSGGYEIIQDSYATLGLGFRRLSIIDTSVLGNQPMFSSDKKIVLLFNGEIFNYKEIRKDLEELKVTFRSHSDTEVIIEGYRHFGIEIINRFIGFFSIVLYDFNHSLVYFVRDRAGVKPFFYYLDPSCILFASELKALHCHPQFKKSLNIEAVAMFFKSGSISAPHCIFNNTFKVEPGHFIKIDLITKALSNTKYWDVFNVYNKPVNDISYSEALEITESKMSQAFQYRTVSDVPIGVFLSGGYDSTALTALLSKSGFKLNTYTIGFQEKEFDESKYALDVSKHFGTNHNVHICSIKDSREIIEELPRIYDEPFGDASAIPTILLSRFASKHVKVALSADGGDELFAGYTRHKKILESLEKFGKYPQWLKSFSSQIISSANVFNGFTSSDNKFEKLRQILLTDNPLRHFDIMNATYCESEIEQLLSRKLSFLSTEWNQSSLLDSNISALNKVLAFEYKTYLVDDILQKVDRATMSTSLEGREPFLDHQLLEWIATLPSSYKLEGNQSKKLLKDIVHKYIPENLMDRPKMGFNLPIDSWLKNDLRGLFEEALSNDTLHAQEVLDPKLVQLVKHNFLNSKNYSFQRVWLLFIFMQWYRRWMV